MTDGAAERLLELEKNIERAITSMLDMAWSFKQIRDDREYKHAGYATFEDYCQQRWGLTRRHVNRVIEAGEIVAELGPTGPTLPSHESQVRPLKALDDPDERAEAWSEAVESAGGQPTAKQVKEAVARRSAPESVESDSELVAAFEESARENDPTVALAHLRAEFSRAALLVSRALRPLDPVEVAHAGEPMFLDHDVRWVNELIAWAVAFRDARQAADDQPRMRRVK